MRVGDLDETELLARVVPLMPTEALLGPGDDAALVAAPDGRVVATTDLLVEGRDFRRDWSTGADVGWKAVAQNVADVAAMGARCSGLLIGLGMPADLEVAWVEDFAAGVAAACERFGAVVVGGDLSAASEVLVAVTALGDLAGRAPVLRSGARPGHVVAVAGRLGRSAAGLDLLQRGVPDAPPELLAAHRRPEPPLAAGPAAAEAGASALMDVSDGLLRDAGRLAVASGVSVELSTRTVLGEWIDDLGDPAPVLTGGEDHALLGCFPPGVELPAPFAVVGRVVERGEHGVLVDGRAWTGSTGWDHFSR
ncbi:thiamine-phosphate kinase [Kineococcus aurantiacus]|uniref:Thiamine-monophosphate kinase n=1 Tax=Kineococcus aurantiacus TaxID=37633 RepID=A0A7Y9ASD7_9ACTN|nr:thiamine-phosphate kinase [Kineococcus aurantiacus]NYD21167.1 thiamine-monophosphate kinase [Kineococcus aurantiacus]